MKECFLFGIVLFCFRGLQDLRAYGKEKGWCPYFLARHMVQLANVVVYSYQYLLDPKVAGIISKEMQKESVVVFDEAHNIDNVCIEALSVSVRRQTLDGASRNISRIEQEINRYGYFSVSFYFTGSVDGRPAFECFTFYIICHRFTVWHLGL